MPSQRNNPMDRAVSERGSLTRAVKRLMTAAGRADRTFLLPGATYGQVHAMAAQLRRTMAEAPGAVCLCAENRAVTAAALIAALHTGRPLLLPYAASAAALRQLHRQIAFAVAVMDREIPLPYGVVPVFPGPGESAPAETAFCVPAPDTEWVRLFTGGSTGRPRIWSKTVENLAGEAAHLVQAYGFGPEDRIVATVPAFHIYGLLYSVLAPLIAGAAVSAHAPSFPREIADAGKTVDATVLISVPVHYRAMRETGVYCRHLRAAFSSAGPLDAIDAEAFHEKTGTGITEIYGSTETGGIAARCRAAGQRSLHPFPVVQWRTASGRLCVRSAFLSPELPTDAEGFFRTADRAAESDEGGFLLLGREDGVVKMAGKRVDTEEIREQIRSFAGVRDAFVAAFSVDTGRGTELGALVEGEVDPSALRRHLIGRLPPHAVPRRLRAVKKIPVTAAGKFDRAAATDLLVR
jgi:acyl-coenzyme A synthetase/AMP-(fatty) acid ligase